MEYTNIRKIALLVIYQKDLLPSNHIQEILNPKNPINMVGFTVNILTYWSNADIGPINQLYYTGSVSPSHVQLHNQDLNCKRPYTWQYTPVIGK